MRIALIAPLQIAVPPHHYGGTERCINNLAEALVKLGYDVTLFATGDSQTHARLIPGYPHALNFDPAVDACALHMSYLQEIYAHAGEFDVIHSHLDYLTLPFVRTTQTPTVLTLHGRLDRPEYRRVFKAFPDASYIAISRSQRRQIPSLNWLATIHHALDLNQFDFYPHPGSYFAFVGRMDPEKGPERAIAIAKRTGIPLKMAAKVDPTERDYFEQVVRPQMNTSLVEFLGEVDERGKQQLMGNALALLAPINWPEPFGMVFIESLAVGTPVLTCPYGSVPELLRDGVTGFIRDTTDDLVAAVDQIGTISRQGCREYVRTNFGVRDMALAYVNAYSLVQRRRAPFQLTPEPADEALLL